MDDLVGSISEIESLEPPLISELPFELIERHNNRATRLVANSGQTQPVEGRNVEFRYHFKEPVFLSHIRINVTGYSEYDRFIIETKNVHGETRKFHATPQDGKVYADVDELCKRISFEPPRAWFRQPMLHSVELFGFKDSETKEFITFAVDLDELKSDAINEIKAAQSEAQKVIDRSVEAQANIDSLNSQIGDAKSALAAVQADNKTATNSLNEIIAKTGATAKQLEATEERLANLHGDIKVETQKKEQLQAEIVASEGRLRELEGNINLFPSEISGFVNQAGSNNRLYLHYAIGPLIIICAMFFLLISGAVDLTTVITTNKDVNLAAILVSRAPYVAVASAIIYASYRIAKIFITEVMNINRQRLSLTKVSIIAKDISQAAETGLNLTMNQVYANRLKVKMALLSDHIRHLINTEPELLFPENLFPIVPEQDAAGHELVEQSAASPRRARTPARRRASAQKPDGAASKQ